MGEGPGKAWSRSRRVDEFKCFEFGAGEMTRELQVLAAGAEELSLVLTPHSSQPSCNSSSRGPDNSPLTSMGTRSPRPKSVHRCTDIHILNNKVSS